MREGGKTSVSGKVISIKVVVYHTYITELYFIIVKMSNQSQALGFSFSTMISKMSAGDLSKAVHIRVKTVIPFPSSDIYLLICSKKTFKNIVANNE